jgi:hypothetical protein
VEVAFETATVVVSDPPEALGAAIAEIHLWFGVDGLPTGLRLEQLVVTPGSLLVCTINRKDHGAVTRIAEGISAYLDKSGFKVPCLVMDDGTSLKALTDDELAEMGLRRIG